MAQLRLEIDDRLKADALAYAARYGISLAAAVRVLLHNALAAEGFDSRRAAAGVAP
jgi:antitoxin component of RelBE/YafQ-DinJ toxin-antitoxin module